jgi:lysozyme family protein
MNFTLQDFNWLMALEGIATTDLPTDNGGLTKAGYTQAAWANYCQTIGQVITSVAAASLAEISAAYDLMFFQKGGCDKIADSRLAFAVFQWEVNHGLTGGIEALQQAADDVAKYPTSTTALQTAVGITVDGNFGPATEAMVNACDPMATITAFLGIQDAWYRAYAERVPAQAVNLNGWLNRSIRTKNLISGNPIDEGTLA